MARRFIVNEKDIHEINEEKIEITGSEVKHIQVLRHNTGDNIIVNEYVCKVLEMRKDSIVLEKVELAPQKGEPSICITLYMAMLKNDKMDFVVQKAVELGVKRIVPFFSKNVVVKLDDKAKAKRLEKLQIIANEACKQCGRTDLVTIGEFINLDNVANDMAQYDICILAYENEEVLLSDVLQKVKAQNISNISVIIGAEGGFEKSEAQQLASIANVESVSLGSRILRAETAALNLLSICMYELGGGL